MNWEQVLGGLALAIPATAIGYMTLRASMKKDAVSEQSGVVSNHRAGIDQVVKGLNDLIDQLQEEVATLRAEAVARAARAEAMAAEIARLRKLDGATDA